MPKADLQEIVHSLTADVCALKAIIARTNALLMISGHLDEVSKKDIRASAAASAADWGNLALKRGESKEASGDLARRIEETMLFVDELTDQFASGVRPFVKRKLREARKPRAARKKR